MSRNAGAVDTPGTVHQHYQVPSALYRINELLEVDTYLYYQGQYILYRSKGHRWKQEDSDKLLDFGVDHLFIKCNSDTEHKEFLDQKLSSVFEDPKLPIQQKAKVLYSTSVEVVDTLYKNPEASESLKRSSAFVKHCINYLNKDRAAFNELLKLASHEFSEHTHALHVAMYSISLAKQIGFRTQFDMLIVGLGAMLHDIGKTKIDKQILIKPSSLDESERKEIEKHPEFGYQMLLKQPNIPDGAKQIVLQHHERTHGRGYPSGLTNEIHIFSKIVAVSDCFDSMTSNRPYKKAQKSLDAVKFMLSQMRSEFEQSILINFVRILQG